MADGVKLLPCPFCGGPGHLKHSIFEIDAGWHVVCHGQKDCPLYCSEPYQVHGDEADAATRWNTRAAPPAMDREAVELAAEAMAEAAKVGPWERMHEKAPRGWGPTACKSYWRNMANIALSTLSADAIRQGEGSLRAHVQKMQEACANYLEPTTYVARHPDTSKIGDCPWVREFEMPDRYASPEGAAQTNKRRDAAFIRDMIYMLDGPEQRAAMPATPASHASDGGKA